MKKILIYLPFIIFLLSCNENIPTDENIIDKDIIEEIVIDSGEIPNKISKIPVKITVLHEPDTVYAIRDEKDTTIYLWKHSTTIKTELEYLKIIEFGAYYMDNGNWKLGNITHKPYTTKEFEQWYFVKSDSDFISWENCKNGVLKANVEYIDPSNWSGKDSELQSHIVLWYYIGIDKENKKYVGYAMCYTVAELKQ